MPIRPWRWPVSAVGPFFVGKVGEDAFGEASVAAYRADGIDTRHVTATRRAPSGVALIMVDQGRRTASP